MACMKWDHTAFGDGQSSLGRYRIEDEERAEIACEGGREGTSVFEDGKEGAL